MRVAPYLLSVLLLGAMPGSADAAPATIEGSWSGSGIALNQKPHRQGGLPREFHQDRTEILPRLVSLLHRRATLRADGSRVEHRRQSLQRLDQHFEIRHSAVRYSAVQNAFQDSQVMRTTRLVAVCTGVTGQESVASSQSSQYTGY